MLSVCQDCYFFHPELCAVNPLYRQKADRCRNRLSEQDLADLCWLAAQLQACPVWQHSAELEPVSVELSLTRRQWLQVSRTLARAGLLGAIAEQLQGVLPNAQEIQMVPVDSSNVAAIGYSSVEQVLVVDFHNGGHYRYFQVPIGVFEAFLAAPSKGRFLNWEIKGTYDFEHVA
jgi:hypothetical protein